MIGSVVLSVSALVLFICGSMALFAPSELLEAVHSNGAPETALIVQVLAGGYLGLAIVNWMSKRNRIGGIYARPLALGNLLLFASGALALGKAAAAESILASATAICILFSVLAIAFGWLAFFHDPIALEN